MAEDGVTQNLNFVPTLPTTSAAALPNLESLRI